MGVVNNFITDLMDLMVKTGASDLMIKPGMLPVLLVRGSMNKGETEVDMEEFIEDLDALGITVDEPANFYYFHHTENEFVHKMRLNISFEGIHDVPVVMMRYILTMLKTELEEEVSP